MANRLIQILVILSLGLSSMAIAQSVYKWVDENGVTNFSQQPPQGIETEKTLIRPAAQTGGTLVEPKIDTDGPSGEMVLEKVNPEPVYEKNPALCERARALLKTLSTGQRLRLKDPTTGEYFHPTDEDLSDQKRQATEQSERFC